MSRGSFKLLTVGGIAVRIHVSFLLIVAFGALSFAPFGVPGLLYGALLILSVFACVTLHELGHSVVARRLDVPVREIVLWPFGGVAMLEREPRRPLHEVLIALAGPAVNVLIALVLGLVFRDTLTAVAEGRLPSIGTPGASSFVAYLFSANVLLAVFNMIPAFPLDGGRVLRGLLAMRLGASRATAIAAHVARALAVLMGLYGVWSGNFVLGFIAVFIFLGASAERAEAQTRDALAGLRAGEAANLGSITLSPSDRVSHVAQTMLHTPQSDFAVLHGETLVGIITRDDVLRVLRAQDHDPYVAGSMRRDFPVIDAEVPLPDARRQMLQGGQRVAAVVEHGALLGLMSLDDLAEAALIQDVVRRQRERRDAAAQAG